MDSTGTLVAASKGQVVTPYKLVFSGVPNTLKSTSCAPSPLTITGQDALSGNTSVSSNATISLSGTAGVTFYSDSGCSATPTATLTVAAGANNGSFYFKSVQGSSVTTTASHASISIAATANRSASQLAFTPSGVGVASGAVQLPSPYRVSLQTPV